MNEKKPKSKIIILGHSPLPFEEKIKNYAPGNRTWHFTQSAIFAGYDVLLVGSRIGSSYDDSTPEILYEKQKNLEYYSVSQSKFEDKKWLQKIISNFKPDCILGVTTYPSSIVSELDIEIPFWADLYGSAMAETQAKSFVYKDDSFLSHFFNQESKILSKADVFSTVSEAQGFSLVGELGLWGRLNKNTLGYRFVRVIPATAENKLFTHTKTVIRGKLVKASDFVILYSGGYNTWTDIKTLFYGVEKAMDENPNIVFVSTGGQIDGHDDLTYENFKRLIESSDFKDRFYLCGWVPKEDLASYYFESDIGINVDKYCYEAILGSRTRVLDWMRASLTFISTPLSEITNYLIEKQLAYGFNPGNVDQLATKLVYISQNMTELESKKNSLPALLSEEFTFDATSQEFLDWLKNPTFSPDHGIHVPLISLNDTLTNLSQKSKLALSLWPILRKSLSILGLKKYENRLKNYGARYMSINSDEFFVKFLNCDIPKIDHIGNYSIAVNVKNIGNSPWKTPTIDPNPVNLSYRWLDQKENYLDIVGNRQALTDVLNPDESVSLNLNVSTPKKSGCYTLEIDMVKENEFWFADNYSVPFRKRIELK